MFEFTDIANLEFRSFLGRYLSTGNALLDMIIGILVFKLLVKLSNVTSSTEWSAWFEEFKSWVWPERPKHRGEIVYYWRNQGSGSRTDLRRELSLEYKAIMKKVAAIKDERVRKLRECRLSYQDQSDFLSPSLDQEVKESIYECIDSGSIQVTSDISVCLTESNNEVSTAVGGAIQVQERNLTLFSKKKSPQDLLTEVASWVDDYEADRLAARADCQLIFQIKFDHTKNQQILATPFHSHRSFDNFFFEHRNQVIQELEFFENNEKWYQRRGLPHTLGILAYGEPGCGKTSLIKAILNKTKRHAIVFSVNRFTNLNEVEKLMRSDIIDNYIIPQNKRVYVFEDIDAMGDVVMKRDPDVGTKKKQNQLNSAAAAQAFLWGALKTPPAALGASGIDPTGQMGIGPQQPGATQIKGPQTGRTGAGVDEFGQPSGGISHIIELMFGEKLKKPNQNFSFFLNLLDGVIEAPGRMIILTTNHVNKLDCALIRPGRVDLKLKFRRCSTSQIKNILSHFYDKDIHEIKFPSWMRDRLITPARLGQICRASKRNFEGAMETLLEELRAELDKRQQEDSPQSW